MFHIFNRFHQNSDQKTVTLYCRLLYNHLVSAILIAVITQKINRISPDARGRAFRSRPGGRLLLFETSHGGNSTVISPELKVPYERWT
jgi:hypothetical protein